jgi:hypothetical protein
MLDPLQSIQITLQNCVLIKGISGRSMVVMREGHRIDADCPIFLPMARIGHGGCCAAATPMYHFCGARHRAISSEVASLCDSEIAQTNKSEPYRRIGDHR